MGEEKNHQRGNNFGQKIVLVVTRTRIARFETKQTATQPQLLLTEYLRTSHKLPGWCVDTVTMILKLHAFRPFFFANACLM